MKEIKNGQQKKMRKFWDSRKFINRIGKKLLIKWEIEQAVKLGRGT